MKQLVAKALRLVCTPARRLAARRNGTTSTAPRHEMPNNVLLGMARDDIRRGHTATIPVKGYSMRPFLEHLRDKVLLVRPDHLHVCDAVLAEIAPGKYVLHRIIAIDGTRLTLMGDGNVRGTEQCDRSDVAGLVSQYIRPRRTLLASDPALRRRIRLWRRLLPLRRYLLFIYKALI